MSVLGNISLSGLTVTNSDYVLAGEVQITNALIVDSGATISLPNNSITDNALSTNVMLCNAAQDSTAQKNFVTNVQGDTPVQVQYVDPLGAVIDTQIVFVPNCLPSSGNPFTNLGDTCIVGSSDFVLGKMNRFTSMRFTDTDVNIDADNFINLNLLTQPKIAIAYNSVTVTPQFFSNFTDPVLYENQFAGSIWGEKDLTCKMGLFVQDQILPGAITYASIDNNGDAEFNSLTISSAGTTVYATIDAAGAAQLASLNSPIITTTTQATADNSTNAATTAFVKNQGYAILNASNSFTGTQTLTTSGTNFPLRVKNSTAVTTKELCTFVAQSASNYNPIVVANDCVVLGRDSGTIDTGVLTLTTHGSTNCGIRITNNTINIRSGTTTFNGTVALINGITANSYEPADSSYLGFTNKITSGSWTATPGATIAQLYSFVFDNGANYKYGTYRFELMIRYTSTVNTQKATFNFDTASASTNALRMVARDSDGYLIGTTYYFTFNMSFVDEIYANKTWYFNGLSTIATLSTASYIQITRVG